nr:unnamed protein product [Callosobruchus analis]
MNVNGILSLLDETPSDPESEEDISDDEGGESIIYNNKTSINQQQPIYIHNIPTDFVDDNSIPKNMIEEWDCLKTVKDFAEDFGPNASDQTETPTDTFLPLFPERLIDLIAFQTNLYSLQIHGNRSAFKATNKDEITIFLAVN